MAPEHAGAGVAHDRAHALAHRGIVAMDRAAGAGGLALAEDAAVDAPRRIVHELFAFAAQIRSGRVLVAAVDAHHREDRRELAGKARVAIPVVRPAGRRGEDGLEIESAHKSENARSTAAGP